MPPPVFFSRDTDYEIGKEFRQSLAMFKSRSTASARLSAYASLITDTQTKQPPFTPNFRVIAFCCTRQAEPLISTATRQTFEYDV